MYGEFKGEIYYDFVNVVMIRLDSEENLASVIVKLKNGATEDIKGFLEIVGISYK